MAEKILITGTSSGFGKLIVDALLAAGHEVAASVRNPKGRNVEASAALKQSGAHVVEIDVTDDQSVSCGVAEAQQALGGLTALINNAGIGVTGLQEAFTPDDFKRLFDINVFGVQRMNRAVLPGFRAQGRGVLMHISSLLGRITVPFYGPYNASKWALEALAENYRAEVSTFGVETCLIEPGGFPTKFMDRLMKPGDQTRDAGYGEMAKAPQATLESFHEMLLSRPEQNPKTVAKAVVDVMDAPHGSRPFRTVVDHIGMGPGVESHNEAAHKLTAMIYENMQISHLLKVKG